MERGITVKDECAFFSININNYRTAFFYGKQEKKKEEIFYYYQHELIHFFWPLFLAQEKPEKHHY